MLDPTLRWNGAAWFAEAGGWITERLGERGVTVRTIERHRIRFWSAVLTVDTDRGRYWERLPELLEQQLAEAARTPAEHPLHLDAEQRAAARARLPQLREGIEVLAGAPSCDDDGSARVVVRVSAG